MDQTEQSLLLSASLLGYSGTSIRDGVCRKYTNSITTETNIRRVNDYHCRRLVYEVEARYTTTRTALRGLKTGRAAMDCSYPTNEILANDFVGYARRYGNFGPSWARSDLTGLVEKISCALGYYTVDNTIGTSELRGGEAISVVALGSMTTPVTASTGCVFIPVVTSTNISPHVFSVLCSAANACGSTVCTDFVEIDARDSAIIMPAVAGKQFAHSCVEALRILGANMSESGAGDLFSYAVTRGTHQALTLIGHTDEGGYVRSVLRVSGFQRPFGGIHFGYSQYKGLPSVVGGTDRAVTIFCDSILLSTAALVAHCDPTIEYEGKSFPSIFCSPNSPVAEAGTEAHIVAEASRPVAAQIVSSGMDFTQAYIPGLMKLFGVTGSCGHAATHMVACMQFLVGKNERHCAFPVVAPFFYVEPTGLLTPNFLGGNAAEKAGFGSLCGPHGREEYPAFEDIEVVPTNAINGVTMYLGWRNARSNHLVNHLVNHPMNGLGSTRIRQVDPKSIICPGGPSYDPVSERLEKGWAVSDSLWERGQSPLPAPLEMVVSDCAMVVAFENESFDPDSGAFTPTHLPTRDELLGGRVKYSCGQAGATTGGPAHTRTFKESRARTRAAVTLAAAKQSFYTGFGSFADEVPVRAIMPRRPGKTPPQVAENPDEYTPLALETTASTERSDPVAEHDAGREVGPRANTVVEMHAVKGPRVEKASPTTGGAGVRTSSLTAGAVPQSEAAQGEDTTTESVPRAAEQ